MCDRLSVCAQVSLDPSSNMLTITGQKEAKEGESQSRMSFTRSFSLPQVRAWHTCGPKLWCLTLERATSGLVCRSHMQPAQWVRSRCVRISCMDGCNVNLP